MSEMKGMRYKLTLTLPDGTVLERWNVCIDKGAEIGDEYNLKYFAAKSALVDEIVSEMIKNERS